MDQFAQQQSDLFSPKTKPEPPIEELKPTHLTFVKQPAHKQNISMWLLLSVPFRLSDSFECWSFFNICNIFFLLFSVCASFARSDHIGKKHAHTHDEDNRTAESKNVKKSLPLIVSSSPMSFILDFDYGLLSFFLLLSIVLSSVYHRGVCVFVGIF